MGLRTEIVLFLAIIAIVYGSFTIKLDGAKKEDKPFTKELEFTSTTFTEVDTAKLQAKAYGTYGIRDDGVLLIHDLVYQTETIHSLVANRGTYKGAIIYLEGNVLMDDNNGYHYETQQAEYNQESEILDITAPFVATNDKKIFKGDTLQYHTRTEEAYSTVVDVILYTHDK
jgi:lipopolysaccharide assembly outer membrane protein LptD (OstA)